MRRVAAAFALLALWPATASAWPAPVLESLVRDARRLLPSSLARLMHDREAATEEGASSESLNFAALKQLPIIFFCENNFYSVQSPLWTRQPHREIWKWARSYGIESVHVDGMNVLAVFEETRRAVERARTGAGPTFIEAPCYRYRAHGGSGDDTKTGYRDTEEREAWDIVDPVALYADYLKELAVVSDEQIAGMRAEIAVEIDEAFAHAVASPNPTEADLYRHVYAD